uniref:(northern house mosquito) hypothetical protein n=1 Tax=Culex pipiens TaxID=7175 RepID=A0A8D8G573_CULPI
MRRGFRLVITLWTFWPWTLKRTTTCTSSPFTGSLASLTSTLLMGSCPTLSWPLCVLLLSQWSTAPPASLSSAMLTKTSTSLWRSGQTASGSKSRMSTKTLSSKDVFH